MAHKKEVENETVPGLQFTKNQSSSALLDKIRTLLPKSEPCLLERHFKEIKTNCVDGESITIFSWNTLAQALSTGKDNFAGCPPEALKWDRRRLQILEEMLKFEPDILCLQEVDHFGLFQPAMASIGYQGFFLPKPDSPALYVKETNGPDGCAMFYKTSKLSLERKNCICLKGPDGSKTNQVSMICTFKLMTDETKRFHIATTHLKAKKGCHGLRAAQGRFLADHLEVNYSSDPVIVCGDFNADNEEEVYKVFETSKLKLSSAYKQLNGKDQEPPFTTWKFRGTEDHPEEHCRTIDYMWYTGGHLQLTHLLDLPTEEQIGPGRLPSMSYPSDHLSLAAKFILS